MVLVQSILTDRDRAVLSELEALVRETYQLWDEIWVGFSWRNYTFDHVMRVRNLARTIADIENGDLRALEFGATLHDVTKSFDGEILMRDGKRVVDADGFWLNEKLPPARRNRVVDLYDELELEGTVHHVSGGQVATWLLRDYGYDEPFSASVREIIAAHLKPHADASLAGLSLYDADAIDANIGLPAFYRNIQITMHRMEQDYARRNENLDDYLGTELQPFLTSYLGERIPAWIQGKHNDFVAKLMTEAGRDVARDRITALSNVVAAMAEELNDFDRNVESGRLAVIKRFIENRNNPALSAEARYLQEEWRANEPTTDGARDLLDAYDAEIAGKR
jgi:HD superfamily phosphohydrolase YqeK